MWRTSMREPVHEQNAGVCLDGLPALVGGAE
jgi:hypothetical protein